MSIVRSWLKVWGWASDRALSYPEAWHLWRWLRLLLLIYVAVGTWGWLDGDRRIFLPFPSSYGNEGDILQLASGDKETIAALHLTNPDADLTLLYSHGNAEDLGDIRPRLERLQNLGFNVLAYDYRGYGLSSGRPTERGAYADIEAAYRYLRDRQHIPAEQIVLFGRSIGSGPSLYLASQEPVGGLILESAFVSIFRILTRLPLYPFDKFPNLQRIAAIDCPVLLIHGDRDRVIPFWHGQALFERASEPKVWFPVPGAGHNDVWPVAGASYDRQLQAFARQLLADRNRETTP